MGQTWNAAPSQVRRSIDDYLVQKLQCQLLSQRQGWKYVALTAGTKSTLRIFLAALKLFYQVMREREMYPFANPLVNPISATIVASMARLESEEDEQTPPRMPDKSGDLIDYMKWKSDETLAAYEHYFEQQLEFSYEEGEPPVERIHCRLWDRRSFVLHPEHADRYHPDTVGLA